MEQLGARRAHNPKVTGSSPVPATKERKSSEMVTFFVLHLSQTYIYIVIKEEFNLYLLGSISPFLETNFLTIKHL